MANVIAVSGYPLRIVLRRDRIEQNSNLDQLDPESQASKSAQHCAKRKWKSERRGKRVPREGHPHHILVVGYRLNKIYTQLMDLMAKANEISEP